MPVDRYGNATGGMADKFGNIVTASGSVVAPTGNEALELREVGGREVSIRLTGRGLPKPPFTLDGVHDIAKSRALGSRFTIHQPTGASEGATELSGEWNDIYLAGGAAGDAPVTLGGTGTTVIEGVEAISLSSTQASSAREACAAMDDFRVRGCLLRVTWAHVARLGRVVKFTQRWLTRHDVEWDLAFEWVGPDEDVDLAPPESVDPADDAREIEAGITAALEATTFPTSDVDPTLLALVDRRLAAIRSGALEIEDTVRTRVDGATTQVEVFRRVVGVLGFVGEEAELLALEISGRVAGTWIANVNPEDLTDLTPSQVMAALVTKTRAKSVARAIRWQAARRRYDHLASVEEVAAIYMAREGDDLQSIARFHYGSEDAAALLLAFNHFTSYTLEPGTIVLAPQRRGSA